MTSTFLKMIVIYFFLSFIICQTSSKHWINTTTVKGITKDNVLMGLIPNVTMIYTRKIRPKSLGLEINDNVSILDVVWTDYKERLIKKIILCHSFCLSGGKVTYQFGKNQIFLWLGSLKLQIKLLENHYPFGVFSPQQLSIKDVLHRVAIGNDCGSA